MAKTIDDYKKDYAAAAARGDAAGMQAANDGANAIRRAQGQAEQKATQHITNVAATGAGLTAGGKQTGGFTKYIDSSGKRKEGYFSGGGSPAAAAPAGSGGYTKYTGGNAALDAALKEYSEKYVAARAAGDPVAMREANDRANQLRNQYGYAAEDASRDIETVKGQGGYYGGMVTGGAGTAAPRADSYTDLIEQWQRSQEEIRAQQEAAARAAVEQAVGKLDGQKAQLDDSYEALYRQLYLDRRMAEKNLPQQLAAMGHTGGLTESSALALQTGYAEALRQGELERLGQISDLDRAIAETRLQGDISIAENAAQLAQQGFSTYAELAREKLEQDDYLRQFEYQKQQDAQSQANWERQLALSQAQAELGREDTTYERKLALAKIMAEYGDFSGYRAMGIDTAAMEANYASMLDQQRKPAEDAPKLGMTVDQAVERFNSGDYSDMVVQTLLDNGYTEDQLRKFGWTGGTITGYDQLGAEAQRIIMGASRGYASAGSVGHMVDKALHANPPTITQAEADFILRSIGY